MSSGKIVQVIGAVIDVEFPRDAVPAIYDALTVGGKDLLLEVQQQLGDGIVRTIAMGSTEGVRRGLDVSNTHSAVSVPVGKETLGRIMDVLGRPIDEKGPIGEQRSPHHERAGEPIDEKPVSASACRFTARRRPTPNSRRAELLETGIKVIDLIMPFQGRQDRPVRWRGRGQDRDADGTDPQHRDRALGTRCLPAWASVPARGTTSTTR